MSLHIGITGGIGSGKSTVAKMFEVLGVPVYYADEAAKRLMNTDGALKDQIIREFGAAAYTGNTLNRSYLSSIVFNNAARLQVLNSMVHPATLADAAEWMEQQTAPYAIKEAALIFESGAQENLDKVIGVAAPKALRIQRVMNRDNISREAVLERMNKQIDETIKIRLCDFVITNDEQQLIIPQVVALHQQLMTNK